MDTLFQGLWILMKAPLINPMYPWNYKSYIAKTHRSSTMGHLDLVNNGIIDARWNKYVIILYCTFVLIPCEAIILSHIIMLHIENEIEQMLLYNQLGWSPKNAMCLPYGPCKTSNGCNHKLCQFFKFFQNEIGESFTQT